MARKPANKSDEKELSADEIRELHQRIEREAAGNYGDKRPYSRTPVASDSTDKK